MLRAESSSLGKKTGCPLLFRNSFLSPFSLSLSFLCLCTVFIGMMRDWERELKGGRLKSMYLILAKHRPPPFWQTYKQSNIHE